MIALTSGYIGKYIEVLFQDDDKLSGKCVGYASELDNEEGVASIYLQSSEKCYELFENEIKEIKEI